MRLKILLLLVIAGNTLNAQKWMGGFVFNYQRIIPIYRSTELFSQNSSNILNNKADNSNAFSFGFNYWIKINNNISLSKAYMFGFREYDNVPGLGIASGDEAAYFSLPISINYTFKFRRINPFLGLGFNNHLPLFAVSDQSVTGLEFIKKTNLKPYMISSFISAGINIRFENISSLKIQFDLDQHLSSVSKGSVRLIPLAPSISICFLSGIDMDQLTSSCRPVFNYFRRMIIQ